MKKIVKLIVLFIILLLIFELLVVIFKTHHEKDYTLKDGKIKYKIHEVFRDKKYYYKVKYQDKIYAFEVDNKFYKRKKTIKKLITYNKGDYSCVYPVYKNDDVSSNIVCSKGNKTYSYEYYKSDLGDFVSFLKKKGYRNLSWNKKSNEQKKLDTLMIYPNSIRDNTYIYIYNYKGFYTINKEEQSNLKLLKNDKYKNNLGSQVGKYYLIPNYDENHFYNHFYRIDMTKNKVKKFKIKKKINSDSYVNGVIDNDMYIFDKDNLIQYKINAKKKKQKEVGNKEDKVLNYDLEFVKTDVYTMRDNEVKFKTVDDYIDKLEKNTSVKFIEKTGSTYYYQTEDDNVYYYNSNSKVKVLLFNMKISDFKLVNNTIYFISNDSLYSYNIDYDLDKIVTYNELSFNPKNRIAIYMEE